MNNETQTPAATDVTTGVLFESGEGGIRTLGELAPTPVFETGTIGHSVTSPGNICTVGDHWFSVVGSLTAGIAADNPRSAEAFALHL